MTKSPMPKFPAVPAGLANGFSLTDALGQQWCTSIDEDQEHTLYVWYKKNKSAKWSEVLHLPQHKGFIAVNEEKLYLMAISLSGKVNHFRINEYVHSIPE